MKLNITNYAWEKILAFTDLCPHEISGLGKLELINGDFVVLDVAIFEQEVSGAHSTIEPKALAKFQHDRVKKGESMKQWCLWWHSHADMGVFFSGTDTGTIDQSNEFPYLVSLVVNKRHEKEARMDLFKPFRMTTPLAVAVITSTDSKLQKICQAEIDKKVVFPKVKESTGYSYSGWTREITPWKSPREVMAQRDYTPHIPFDNKAKEEREQEFREHRKYLVKQIHKAKRKGSKADKQRAMRQLSEWDSWGQGLGLIINGS